jgi:hypothetical protein
MLKEAKIEHYKGKDLEIKFSQLAFLPNNAFDPKSEPQEDNEELLYYSSAPRS